MLPVSTSLAASGDMNGAGSVFSMRATAAEASAFLSVAPAGTMSSSSTGTPALATWAAMPAPHHACADDADLADRGGHHARSRRVAMPWPPPMHWVASA